MVPKLGSTYRSQGHSGDNLWITYAWVVRKGCEAATEFLRDRFFSLEYMFKSNYAAVVILRYVGNIRPANTQKPLAYKVHQVA